MDFKKIVDSYTAADAKKRIHGVALLAVNVKGETIADFESGVDSMDPARAKPFTKDAYVWGASMTKLMTAICAMQCVERGLIDLDENVVKWLPELKHLQILEGFDGDTPKLRPANNIITPSGITYDFANPLLQKWYDVTGIKRKTPESIAVPLMFEPGESWNYGYSSEWSGLMVERATGMKLQAYMEKNLWGPLGITKISFKDNDKAADTAYRVDPATLHHIQGSLNEGVFEFDAGGAGANMTARDYVKILLSLLKSDGKLLKPETVDAMFKPQLKNPGDMQQIIHAGYSGGSATVAKLSHTLAGQIILEPSVSGRHTNTISWGGLPNCNWWIDREAGICGTTFTQVMPVGDLICRELWHLFDLHIYGEVLKKSGSP